MAILRLSWEESTSPAVRPRWDAQRNREGFKGRDEGGMWSFQNPCPNEGGGKGRSWLLPVGRMSPPVIGGVSEVLCFVICGVEDAVDKHRPRSNPQVVLRYLLRPTFSEGAVTGWILPFRTAEWRMSTHRGKRRSIRTKASS